MDDFSACANAEPVSRLEQLERENADFRTWGIIEIATRNPNVAEYMTHWEARAKKAEAENEALRARLEMVEAETRERCAQAAEKWRRKKLGLKPGTVWFDPCGRWDGEPLMEEGRDRDLIAAAIRNLEPRHD